MSYESSIGKVEEITAKLQSNEIPLDEAVKLFTEGVGELEKCRKELENAKFRVNEVIRSEEKSDE